MDTLRPFAAVGLAILALVVLSAFCAIALSYVDLGVKTATKPAELLDPDRIERNYKWFYDVRRDLQAKKENAQDLQRQMDEITTLYGDDANTWPITQRQIYSQLSSRRVSIETAYNEQCAEYMARWDNFFTNLTAPTDLPRSCP